MAKRWQLSKKGGRNMQTTVFEKFVKTNRDKIKRIAEANTLKNKEGVTVLAKDDPWRTENEWDELYKTCNYVER